MWKKKTPPTHAFLLHVDGFLSWSIPLVSTRCTVNIFGKFSKINETRHILKYFTYYSYLHLYLFRMHYLFSLNDVFGYIPCHGFNEHYHDLTLMYCCVLCILDRVTYVSLSSFSLEPALRGEPSKTGLFMIVCKLLKHKLPLPTAHQLMYLHELRCWEQQIDWANRHLTTQ